MDKVELKKVIKPLIKECIREVLMEQGLSKMISEAAVAAPVATQKQEVRAQPVRQNNQINEARKKMIEEIGKSGYMNNSFDPFSNTEALTESQATDGAGSHGPLRGIDPNDPGVDISNLMNGNKNVWKALVGGKGK
mgnify:CR=1 FL=1